MVGIYKHFSKKFNIFYEGENAVKEERKGGGMEELVHSVNPALRYRPAEGPTCWAPLGPEQASPLNKSLPTRGLWPKELLPSLFPTHISSFIF